jgi:hypothetical protein
MTFLLLPRATLAAHTQHISGVPGSTSATTTMNGEQLPAPPSNSAAESNAMPRLRSTIMIRNGLYLASTTMLDGVDAHNRHVMVLRDGTIRGGGPFFYTVGTFTCSGSNWKGEMTSQEHTPIIGTHPWARKVISIGFTGTYFDDGAELHATALVGKRSFRFKSIYRLLVAD